MLLPDITIIVTLVIIYLLFSKYLNYVENSKIEINQNEFDNFINSFLGLLKKHSLKNFEVNSITQQYRNENFMLYKIDLLAMSSIYPQDIDFINKLIVFQFNKDKNKIFLKGNGNITVQSIDFEDNNLKINFKVEFLKGEKCL